MTVYQIDPVFDTTSSDIDVPKPPALYRLIIQIIIRLSFCKLTSQSANF